MRRIGTLPKLKPDELNFKNRLKSEISLRRKFELRSKKSSKEYIQKKAELDRLEMEKGAILQ